MRIGSKQQLSNRQENLLYLMKTRSTKENISPLEFKLPVEGFKNAGRKSDQPAPCKILNNSAHA
jgi:hypothetical protein